jgi:hypothetical protein
MKNCDWMILGGVIGLGLAAIGTVKAHHRESAKERIDRETTQWFVSAASGASIKEMSGRFERGIEGLDLIRDPQSLETLNDQLSRQQQGVSTDLRALQSRLERLSELSESDPVLQSAYPDVRSRLRSTPSIGESISQGTASEFSLFFESGGIFLFGVLGLSSLIIGLGERSEPPMTEDEAMYALWV